MSFRDQAIASLYTPADNRLEGFYIPALKQAVRYDRVTGYYRSSSLVVAAAGISRFVANGGTMRIIAGTELDELDIKAIEKGEPLSAVLARRMLLDPVEGADIVAKRRLETLAYLAREGRLEIRIGVPLDKEGRPLPASKTKAYFHAKFGILEDREGNRLAFIGSDNESAVRLARQLRGLHGREVVAARGLEGDGRAARRPVRGALERAARRGVAGRRPAGRRPRPPDQVRAARAPRPQSTPRRAPNPLPAQRPRIRSCSSSRLPRVSTEALRSASRPPA